MIIKDLPDSWEIHMTAVHGGLRKSGGDPLDFTSAATDATIDAFQDAGNLNPNIILGYPHPL